MPTSGPIRPLFAGIKIQSTRDQDGHDINSGMMDETDGSQANETIHFGLDGADFELNLSKAHVDELRQTLAPYIKAARKTMTKEDSQRRGLGAIYIRIKQG